MNNPNLIHVERTFDARTQSEFNPIGFTPTVGGAGPDSFLDPSHGWVRAEQDFERWEERVRQILLSTNAGNRKSSPNFSDVDELRCAAFKAICQIAFAGTVSESSATIRARHESETRAAWLRIEVSELCRVSSIALALVRRVFELRHDDLRRPKYIKSYKRNWNERSRQLKLLPKQVPK